MRHLYVPSPSVLFVRPVLLLDRSMRSRVFTLCSVGPGEGVSCAVSPGQLYQQASHLLAVTVLLGQHAMARYVKVCH